MRQRLERPQRLLWCGALGEWIIVTGADTDSTQRALRLSQRAVELRPEQARNWNTLAFILIELHEYAEAVNALSQAEAINHDDDPMMIGQTYGANPLNLIMRSVALFKLGRDHEAKADLTNAVTDFNRSGANVHDREFDFWYQRALVLEQEALAQPALSKKMR